MTPRLLVAAAVAAAVVCWTAALLGGTDGLCAGAAACTLLAMLAARHALLPQRRPAPPPATRAPLRPRTGYPRLRQLQTSVEWACRDRRYHDRVLVPLLAQLGADADDEAGAAALRVQIESRLARTERRGHRWT